MVGGQVSSSATTRNNNNDNNNNNNNNNFNNNIPLNGFQHQFLKWGRRKVLTSTASFRLQDLCRKVQLFLCGRHRDHEIVSITARIRNDGILYWNLAAIRIIGFFIKIRCSRGNEEIRFHYLQGYYQRHKEILVLIL